MIPIKAYENVLDIMRAHVADGAISKALKINEMLLTQIVDAISLQDRKTLAQMREKTGAFKSTLIGNEDASSLLHKISGNCEILTIATRRMPDFSNKAITLTDDETHAKHRLYDIIMRDGPIRYVDAMEKSDLTPPIMKRLCTALKMEGKVTSTRAGTTIMLRRVAGIHPQ